MNDIYMQNILDHFHNPENYGEMKDFDIMQAEFNPFCGDKITVYFKMLGENVNEVKFVGEGCAISQASMSILSEKLKGLSIKEIQKMDADFITNLLGITLMPTRLKCALLGLQAVKNGLKI